MGSGSTFYGGTWCDSSYYVWRFLWQSFTFGKEEAGLGYINWYFCLSVFVYGIYQVGYPWMVPCLGLNQKKKCDYEEVWQKLS